MMKKALSTFLFALVFAQYAVASVTISSSQIQVESKGMVNPVLGITGGTPWDFTSQNYLGLNQIDEMSVTLTLYDGDTDSGEFDEGELMLELDGLNTGLALDGFGSDVTTVNYTVTGPNQAAGLLNALQVDGYLLGNILDLSPNDNYVKVVGGYLATLTLTDHELSVVPVPGAVLLCSLGVIGAVWLKRKTLLMG